MTIETTLVRASGTAGAAGADAAENVVAVVLTGSIEAGAKEYVVGASARLNVLSLSDVVSLSWVTDDIKWPEATEKLVRALLKLFDAFRSAESPLTESRVLSSSSAGGTFVIDVSSSLDAGGASSLPVAPLALARESSEVLFPAALFRMDLTTERNRDLGCDFRSEADGPASSASAEAAPVRAGVVLVVDGLLVDEDVLVDEDSVFDEESPLGEEPGESAYAIPGVFAIAAPTPTVTASAPTRPMCRA